jgi:hypothetical protein
MRTPDGLYFPPTLPSGPASGPAQFQQRASEVLGISRGTEVASCIDDLGLYAETCVQLVHHEPRDDAAALGQVRHPAERREVRVLHRGAERRGTLSASVHIVISEGVQHTQARIAAIRAMAVRATRTRLSFSPRDVQLLQGQLPHARPGGHLVEPAVG